MRFASLGSGSAGNSLIIQEKTTSLLLDCGFNTKETILRLARLSITPEQITGILITHEHDDHASGAFKFAKKYNIPVWLSYGTQVMSTRYLPKAEAPCMHVIDSHQAFQIQDLSIQPFPVPHDAREPIQFSLSNGQYKLGVLTDTGCSTPYIETMLNQADALVLECNHDVEMLNKGPYSRALKSRIAGRLGHLDNQVAAQLLSRLDNSKLKHIIAAHLSLQNNHPELATQALASALNCDKSWIGIAKQEHGFDWRSL